MHIEILRLLADGRFHSGEEMALTLGISRAAIWKQISTIRKLNNLKIHAVPGRGYKLQEPLELLDVDAINGYCSQSLTKRLSYLEIHDRIASTNEHLMRQIHSGIHPGHVCIAEQQTAGRGRRGRKWVSPFGCNIYLSIYWRYQLELANLSGLSLAAGIAVARCLRQWGVEDIGLKWPNDLIQNGKKLAGLLLEVSGEQGGLTHVVLGLGLNMKLTEQEAATIDQPWTALQQLPGVDVSRNRLIAELLDYLLEGLEKFEAEGLEPLVPEWNRYDHYLGQKISLTMVDKKIEGVHRGISENGALLLETATGIRSYHGGEVSLRASM